MKASENGNAGIEIFIGSEIQNQSELDCLRSVCETLAGRVVWAYIFANFHAWGRQIDLAVFTEKTMLVIEVKGYSLPVSGGLNGHWQQLCSGGIRKIRNGYSQALDAKNALKNVIQKIDDSTGYPNGIVVVTPSLHKSQNLTPGDFKIAVISLTDIAHHLIKPSNTALSRAQCIELSKQLDLEPIESLDAATNDRLNAAIQICNNYSESFIQVYSPMIGGHIDDQYQCDDSVIDSTQILSTVTDGDGGIQIQGPSGCGKTMLSILCATTCVTKGCVPIFIAAHFFDGDFRSLLNKEVSLLTELSAKHLIAACKTAGKRLVLFLDGYNECPADLKLGLTRALKAFAMRYSVRVVVSTQEPLIRAELMVLKTISISQPTLELKARIANVEIRRSDDCNYLSLLMLANSGLEARLVGEIGSFVDRGASRFAIFDTYVRKKLGTTATEGIRLLSSLADTLIRRVCSSLSIREFDRLCDSNKLTDTARTQILHSHLLQIRGDKVSFIHEMFFVTFVAEAVIRATCGDVMQICELLRKPRYFASKTSIIGAIEDEELMNQVLDHADDQSLILACFEGECGLMAQFAVNRKIEVMLSLMVAEAKNVIFKVGEASWEYIEIEENQAQPELKVFDKYLPAIGQGLMNGQYINEVMSGCRHIDDRIAIYARILAFKPKSKMLDLQDAMFSVAYVSSNSLAISKLVRGTRNSTLSFHHKEGQQFGAVLQAAWVQANTFGQYYFLLGLTRGVNQNENSAKVALDLYQKIGFCPYHLQLALIDIAPQFGSVNEEIRNTLIGVLDGMLSESNVLLNSFIFDALAGIGGMDKAAYENEPFIRREIQEVLTADKTDSDVVAWSHIVIHNSLQLP